MSNLSDLLNMAKNTGISFLSVQKFESFFRKKIVAENNHTIKNYTFVKQQTPTNHSKHLIIPFVYLMSFGAPTRK